MHAWMMQIKANCFTLNIPVRDFHLLFLCHICGHQGMVHTVPSLMNIF